jgi:hypothetical protein
LGVLNIEGYRSSVGIQKVGDVIDSNSCHMRSIRLSHDLRDMWGLGQITIKVLEVPKSLWIKGARSDGPDEASNFI